MCVRACTRVCAYTRVCVHVVCVHDVCVHACVHGVCSHIYMSSHVSFHTYLSITYVYVCSCMCALTSLHMCAHMCVPLCDCLHVHACMSTSKCKLIIAFEKSYL